MPDTPLNRAVQSLEMLQAIETLEFHNVNYLTRELGDPRRRAVEKRRLVEEAIIALRGPLSHYQEERDTYFRLNAQMPVYAATTKRPAPMPERLRDDPADDLGKGIEDIARNLAPAKVVTDVDKAEARRVGAADSAKTVVPRSFA